MVKTLNTYDKSPAYPVPLQRGYAKTQWSIATNNTSSTSDYFQYLAGELGLGAYKDIECSKCGKKEVSCVKFTDGILEGLCYACRTWEKV